MARKTSVRKATLSLEFNLTFLFVYHMFYYLIKVVCKVDNKKAILFARSQSTNSYNHKQLRYFGVVFDMFEVAGRQVSHLIRTP